MSISGEELYHGVNARVKVCNPLNATGLPSALNICISAFLKLNDSAFLNDILFTFLASYWNPPDVVSWTGIVASKDLGAEVAPSNPARGFEFHINW